ncbi:unnamed protein product [Nippostrongylus brasiliensis]|uniref:UDP-glucuronosyltransferase n=1 Tax=Nippostrongylus brasiliensis TaxID=27835 RepID=A0A0N4Y7K8_NIPBR|nr:unnamed protein product [Nippostrongylus brasiliensis]
MLQEKEFLDWLVAEKFELAFSHMYDVCPIGLIHYAEIPSWIWLNSGALMDFVAHYMGVPNIPSYSPRWLIPDKETAIFRELIDPNFPDIVEVAKKCPLVMVNSNELYELPRPTLAKVVNIGGIGIQIKDAKPLSKEFQQIVDAHEGIVVFSFGSVAPAHRMPEAWKKAFLEAFARFPKIGFIMKYEGTDLGDRLPPNVRLSKWIPQADLLGNPKTVALISHGGYNSLQEAITAGVPLVTVALFGDQPRNAKLAERHRFSINILKRDLNADTVTRALRKLTNDKR